MANIAQTVNVLQAMILTDGEMLLTTPTYHVFDMYSDHQDAEWVDAVADEVDPFLDWTVSYKDGAYTIGIVNTGLERDAATSFRLPTAVANVISARVVAGEKSDAHNTFDAPEVVSPVVFDGYRVAGDTLTVTLPPRAVASLRVQTASRPAARLFTRVSPTPLALRPGTLTPATMLRTCSSIVSRAGAPPSATPQAHAMPALVARNGRESDMLEDAGGSGVPRVGDDEPRAGVHGEEVGRSARGHVVTTSASACPYFMGWTGSGQEGCRARSHAGSAAPPPRRRAGRA